MISEYLRGQLLRHVVRTATFESPKTFIGLLLAEPVKGTVSEVSVAEYARQEVTFDVAGMEAFNPGELRFPAANLEWGVATYIGVFDAARGGQLLWHTKLEEPTQIGKNDQFVLRSRGLVLVM